MHQSKGWYILGRGSQHEASPPWSSSTSAAPVRKENRLYNWEFGNRSVSGYISGCLHSRGRQDQLGPFFMTSSDSCNERRLFINIPGSIREVSYPNRTSNMSGTRRLCTKNMRRPSTWLSILCAALLVVLCLSGVCERFVYPNTLQSCLHSSKDNPSPLHFKGLTNANVT